MLCTQCELRVGLACGVTRLARSKTWRARRKLLDRLKGYEQVYETRRAHDSLHATQPNWSALESNDASGDSDVKGPATSHRNN